MGILESLTLLSTIFSDPYIWIILLCIALCYSSMWIYVLRTQLNDIEAGMLIRLTPTGAKD
jgi:hypothetical protein